MVDALFCAVLCRNVEEATAAYGHLANVGALFRARCDHRPQSGKEPTLPLLLP